MKKIISIFIVVVLLSFSATVMAENVNEYWVDPKLGSNNNPGTRELPFKTINAAKNLIESVEKTTDIIVS